MPEMAEQIRINNHGIGPGQPCYVIAEAGVNHNGSLQTARELILAASEAGADCVKFQTFRAQRLVSEAAPKADYQLRATSPGESQMEMLRKLEMPEEWHAELMSLCADRDIDFISTPYSFEDVDFLDSIDIPAFKLASMHCAEPTFVSYVASKQRPIILSTGMATLAEIEAAVRAARDAGNEQLILLQCTTDYPSRVQDANLRVIPALAQQFNLPVGYSDHTQTADACIAAVALGACVIEKHFTLDRAMPGPDHAASFDAGEFRELVDSIRNAELALGSAAKVPSAVELQNARTMRRSLAARKALRAGETLTEAAVTFVRPASGISPSQITRYLGRKMARDVPAGQLFSLDDFVSGE
jgi:N-acetylneuraminate synthase/N,N'-diacetyllegionaminate synthase